MIGLFVDHDGATMNVPSARFGSISMMPNDKATIKQSTGYKGPSFVVDMHSRQGFSGSPVFAYRTFGNDLADIAADFEFHEFKTSRGFGDTVSGKFRVDNLLKLLGIHWGQFPEKWELKPGEKIEEARKASLITEGGYVEGMSGMTCVIPAWHILEVLQMPSIKTPRDAYFKKVIDEEIAGWTSRPKAESTPVVAESNPAATDENPQHREDFANLLNKAAKTSGSSKV